MQGLWRCVPPASSRSACAPHGLRGPCARRARATCAVVDGLLREARRLEELRTLATKQLHLGDAVRFAPNLSLSELRELLGSAAVGLHTMWNEHFGIGVVEMLAAGVETGA